MKDSSRLWDRFVLGTFLGALLGFIAGLLKAPQSGEQTRAAIRHQSKEAKSALKDSIQQAGAKVASVSGRLAEAASKTRGRSRTAPVAAQARTKELR